MLLFTWANKIVKNLNWFDIKLIALAGACAGILLVRWVSWFAEINIWLLIGVGVLCLTRVWYVLLFK